MSVVILVCNELVQSSQQFFNCFKAVLGDIYRLTELLPKFVTMKQNVLLARTVIKKIAVG